jgi:hypothetical protein
MASKRNPGKHRGPGRPYSVTPTQQQGRSGWYATYRDALGRRRMRSLATTDHGEALRICADLVRLRWDPQTLDIHQTAARLFHGDDPAAVDALIADDHAVANGLTAADQIAQLQAALEAERREHAALRASILGRAADAARRCPPIDEALRDYAAHLDTNVSPREAANLLNRTRKFLASIPEIRTPADIVGSHVSAWLDADAAGAAKPLMRRRKARIMIGRFLRWCSRQYQIPCIMHEVPAPKTAHVDRERGEIRWHTIAEVEAVLRGLDTYWCALVATLAYAGLQLAELVWLRRDDITQREDGQWQIWIVGHDGHRLKTGHRQRAVMVHPSRLQSRLLTHLHAIDGPLVFPTRGRTRRATNTRWREDTLTKQLNGWSARRGYQGRAPSPAKPGILPPDMNALSLRRTFGSLLIRAGKTAEEVAAAMGNTATVVRQHYARILGSEVDVNF